MPRKYITASGDTLPLISFEAYGDETKANVIAEANPKYAGVLIFDEDIILVIPDIESTSESVPPWRR